MNKNLNKIFINNSKIIYSNYIHYTSKDYINYIIDLCEMFLKKHEELDLCCKINLSNEDTIKNKGNRTITNIELTYVYSDDITLIGF
jgi:hypothetical protein